VTTLTDKEQPSGFYEIIWDGTKDQGKTAATGVYFYRIEAEEFISSKKILLMK